MSTSPPLPTEHADRFDWTRIERLLDETASLAQSSGDEQTFLNNWLSSLCSALNAQFGIIWGESPEGFESVAATSSKRARIEARPEEVTRLQNAIRQPGLHLSEHIEESSGQTVSTFDFPLSVARGRGRVLELQLAGKRNETEQRLTGEVIRAFVEVAQTFDQQRELTGLRTDSRQQSLLEAYALEVHQSIDLRTTAYAIVNEGRRVIDCDRLSLLYAPSRRLLAISGVDQVSRHSDVADSLRELAQEVLRSGESMVLSRDASDVSTYPFLAEHGLRTAALVPLQLDGDQGQLIGVLIAEEFEDRTADDLSVPLPQRLNWLVPHATQALENCRTAGTGPVARLARAVSASLNLATIVWRGLLLLVLAGLVVSGFVVKTEFIVHARGELLPTVRRNVFAPRNGVVREVLVDYGETINKDDPLVRIDDADLELTWKNTRGELQTARERIASVKALRASSGGASEDRLEKGRLAGEERELREKIRFLEAQLEVLDTERELLVVRSPLNGLVLTWDVRELLENRPVQTGQRLMTVADPEGEWELVFDVPDRHIGYVVAARDEFGPDLPIQYRLATSPDVTFDAKLSDVGLTSEPTEEASAAVWVTAIIPRKDVELPRPGATVVAQIDCGKKPILFVWFHDVIETLRTRFWL
ncbi:HlyD family efflux transporter periplasmic adaptor subunit [Calycomorphotria hydatis]|uniref:HlyD family secretion protein n=1 Tax=Calycomorphotria hydatis TaxID=2528027 RepID=A0A517T7E2_9PLAN|nr:HlyD family efflux transporter periplasmic adaptor subunit [Calycomorphotria hydatis]QDT64287.1 HlyD family secretion protein [Calycomorphotria hydatis]